MSTPKKPRYSPNEKAILKKIKSIRDKKSGAVSATQVKAKLQNNVRRKAKSKDYLKEAKRIFKWVDLFDELDEHDSPHLLEECMRKLDDQRIIEAYESLKH